MTRNLGTRLRERFDALGFATRAALMLTVSFLGFAAFTAILTPTIAMRVLTASEVSEGERIAATLSKQSVLALVYHSAENAKEVLTNARSFPGVVYAAVYDDTQTIVLQEGDNFDNWQPNGYSVPVPVTTTSLVHDSQGYWHFISPVITSAPDSPFAIAPTRNDYLGYVHIVRSKESLVRLRNSLFFYVAIVSGFALAVALGILLWLTKRILRPIQNLSHTLQQSGFSSSPVRAAESGPPEIVHMARLFNQLMIQIEKHRELLEAEVQARTSDLKAMRDQAEDANRKKSEFLAIASHELRTPLQAIVSYTQMLMQDLAAAGMSTAVRDLNVILHRTNHLSMLINNILDLTKIESGRMDVTWSAVKVRALVQEAVDTIRPLAIERGNEMTVQFHPSLDTFVTDKWKLLQIVLNLVSNACKFTDGGKISVIVDRDDRGLMLTVSDTGPGIDSSEQERIFEAFRRSRADRGQPGSGLGLAVVDRFCTLLGGRISVQSELGRGSVFAVLLPNQDDV